LILTDKRTCFPPMWPGDVYAEVVKNAETMPSVAHHNVRKCCWRSGGRANFLQRDRQHAWYYLFSHFEKSVQVVI